MNITKCKGEGQGSCTRCNERGKWNRTWMCFLNCIEGLEGIYCNDCTKEILSELSMSVEDRMCDGICDGCDMDPAICYNQGYCEYDKEETKDE